MRWVVVAALAAGLIAACDESSTEPVEQTYLVEVSGEQFRVRASGAAVIADLEARRASGQRGVVSGKLRAGNGGYNSPWSWHLEDVHVADMAIELCDGRPSMVEEDTAYWIGTVKQFCPWGAKVVSRE